MKCAAEKNRLTVNQERLLHRSFLSLFNGAFSTLQVIKPVLLNVRMAVNDDEM